MQKIWIIILLSFFTTSYQIFGVGTYGITALDISILILYIYFVKRLLWDGDKLQIGYHPAIFFFLAFFIAVLLSAFNPLFVGSEPMITQYFKSSIHYFYIAVLGLIAISYPIDIKVWNNYIKTFLIIMISINIFGVYQIFARAFDLPLAWLKVANVSITGARGNNDLDFAQLSLHFENFYRATSIFTEPSALASINVLTLVFIVIPFVQDRKAFFQSKVLMIFIFVICLIGLFLTFSLTGLAGVLMITSAVFLIERFKNRLRIVLSVFAVIAIIASTDLIVSRFTDTSVSGLFYKRVSGIIFKKETTSGDSYGMRQTAIKLAIQIWNKYPITGTGLGLTSQNKINGLVFSDITFFAVLSELGIIGAMIYLGLFVTLFFTAYKYLKKSRSNLYSEERSRILGILFYILIYEVLINYVSGHNLFSAWFWIPLTIVFSVINTSKIKSDRKCYEISLLKKSLRSKFNELLQPTDYSSKP